jgi:hypothetical protein
VELNLLKKLQIMLHHLSQIYNSLVVPLISYFELFMQEAHIFFNTINRVEKSSIKKVTRY